MKQDKSQLHRKGQLILDRLAEAIHEMQHLETVCKDHQDTIQQCEIKLESVAIDIASISTNDGEWDEMSQMIRDAGITIPEEFDKDMREMMAGDDSCLD